MANLLDMLMGDQSNLFQMAGIGQPSGAEGGSTPSRPSPAPAAPASVQPADTRGQGPSGVAGVLGGLFGGGNDPRLSKEENTAVQKRALMQAGIAMMASAWGKMPNPGAGLAAGLAVGSEAASSHADAMLERSLNDAKLEKEADMLAVRQRIFSGMDPTNVVSRAQAWEMLVANGDDVGAGLLTDFGKTYPGPIELKFDDRVELRDPSDYSLIGTYLEPEAPEGTSTVDTGMEIILYEDRTGLEVMRWKKGLTPAQARETAKQNYGIVSKMGNDYNKEAVPGEMLVQIANKAIGGDPDNPVSDQVIIVAFNKLIDPGSVVRESEFARTQKAGGYSQAIKAQIRKATHDGTMPDDVRAWMIGEITRMRDMDMETLSRIRQKYETRSQGFQVNPVYLFNDLNADPGNALGVQWKGEEDTGGASFSSRLDALGDS